MKVSEICKRYFYFSFVIIVSLIFGCEKDNIPHTEIINYSGDILETTTNSNGALEIISENFNGENQYDVHYDLKVVDENGKPVPNANVLYVEIRGKSLIYITDPSGQHTSSILYGTPMELRNFSQNLTSIHKDDLLANSDEVKTKSITVASIALLITVGSLAASQVGLITNTYKIETFYKTDVLEANTEYILYCKTFSQIADLVMARGKIATNATSIIFSLAGAGKAVTMHEILGSAEKIGKKALMDRIIGTAVREWGVIVDDIIDKKLVVKVIPFEKKNRFSHIKNLFAVFEIIYDSDDCENFINDVPLEVNEFLNQEFIDILQDRGMEIHKGFDPPDVTGNYYVDSWTNKETSLQYVNYSYQFANQTPNLQIEVNSKSDRAVAFGTGAFISGDGTNFSIYCETDSHISEDDHEVYIKSADIYSGSISQDGILNFEKGFIILEKDNDLNNRYMNVGDSRIVYEADGLASSVSSFPHISTKKLRQKNVYLKDE